MSAINAQQAIHSIDQGISANYIRGAMFVALIISLPLLYLFVQFRGFSTVTAMDQAQIARNLASGKGFSTQFLRPLAVWQLEDAKKPIPKDNFPDFYQSPLNSLVNALPLTFVKSKWPILSSDFVYAPERVIAGVSILCFLLSVAVWYLIGKILFDSQLSLLACAAILMCDMMWQFSLSGLPQMMMLLLFSGMIWLTLLAMKNAEKSRVVLASLFGAGLLFGLLVLAHGLVVWMFLGWLLFVFVYFRRSGPLPLVALAALLIVVTPWLARNYHVCGSALGLAIYDSAAIAQESPESGYLRSFTEPPKLSLMFRPSIIKSGIENQAKEIFSFLGLNLAAAVFFLSLMHPFRSEITSVFRWAVLLMWLGAVFGMAAFGVRGAISSNQLHVLFLPLFIFYGIAFLLVLWARLEFEGKILRSIFLGAILFLCALPMLSTLVSGRQMMVQWPPYFPPFIGILGEWFEEKEIIASDMPWAVAWYANRRSLLLPETLKDFCQTSDFGRLGGPVTGLYLTPVSGNSALFSSIYKGAYKGWAPLIARPPNVAGFPLPFFISLPIDGECIIFSDHPRWPKHEGER